MHTVCYKLHTAHCNAHCTLCNAHCTLCIAHCTRPSERAKRRSERSLSAPNGAVSAPEGSLMVYCYYTLSLYTVTAHCPCTLSMVSLSTGIVHGTRYFGTVRCHCTLHTATTHCHYTLSLYIVTIHCRMYTVLRTLYSPRSHRMCPHTQCVRHNGQDSTLALYTVTLHSLYALTVQCHYTLSLYGVTVNLVRLFSEGVDGNLSPPLCSPLTRPPRQLQPEPKEQLHPPPRQLQPEPKEQLQPQ